MHTKLTEYGRTFENTHHCAPHRAQVEHGVKICFTFNLDPESSSKASENICSLCRRNRVCSRQLTSHVAKEQLLRLRGLGSR